MVAFTGPSFNPMHTKSIFRLAPSLATAALAMLTAGNPVSAYAETGLPAVSIANAAVARLGASRKIDFVCIGLKDGPVKATISDGYTFGNGVLPSPKIPCHLSIPRRAIDPADPR